MANRVLLGNKGSDYGLWVSKSGQDVTSVSSDNLLFDSTRAEGSAIFKSGTVSITVGTTANTMYYSDYVFYNADESALNYIPLVLIWVGAYNYPQRKAQRIVVIQGGRGGSTYYTQVDGNCLYAEVLNNKFRIASKYFGTNGAVSTGSSTVRYAVLAIGGSTITSLGP